MKVRHDFLMKLGLVARPFPQAIVTETQIRSGIEVVAMQNGIPVAILPVDWVAVPQVQRHPRRPADLPLHLGGKGLSPAQIMGEEDFVRGGDRWLVRARQIPICKPAWPGNA